MFVRKRKNPCNQEFPETEIRRQVLDQYQPGISKITSHYGKFTIEILSPQSSNQTHHRIQTDDIELDFSKNFTEKYQKYTTSKITKSKLNFLKLYFLYHL